MSSAAQMIFSKVFGRRSDRNPVNNAIGERLCHWNEGSLRNLSSSGSDASYSNVQDRYTTRRCSSAGVEPNMPCPPEIVIQERPSPRDLFMRHQNMISGTPTEIEVICTGAHSISRGLNASAYRIFYMMPAEGQWTVLQTNTLNPYAKPGSPVAIRHNNAFKRNIKLVKEVAATGRCLNISRYTDARRFPPIPMDLFDLFGVQERDSVAHLMYVPIFEDSGNCNYMLEIWRKAICCKADEEAVSTISILCSMALDYAIKLKKQNNEMKMAAFLMNVAKSIFTDLESLDTLILRILDFAQKLVDADRASLFFIDFAKNELVSRVFDMKPEEGTEQRIKCKEVRMPTSKGIAGYVATTGQTVNIPDAYSDIRFNREVDESTGYVTQQLLSMPIVVHQRIIGVVQMVNKRNTSKTFSCEDESNFEIFSTFFGLALQQARLYDTAKRNEQKYRVALEVLTYHNTCNEHEVKLFLETKGALDINLNDYYLDPFKLPTFEKCKAIIVMFDDLFGISNYDVSIFARFILTVQKNYRNVPYHNFSHGWSVAHAMYVILKNDTKKQFNIKERLALFIASLCHDLDHRGFTNDYMASSKSPLAAMYTTSALEHHHFNITATILHTKGLNFVDKLSRDESKAFMKSIKYCILATDLSAAFFPNLKLLNDIFAKEHHKRFNWRDENHRNLAMALSMTAADLSASAKPWDVQINTVKVIFEEFYAQGDREKKEGRLPIPMMDRTKPHQQASSQVGFLQHICIPCYEKLELLLPGTEPMLRQAQLNYKVWQAKAKKISIENINKDSASSIIDIPTDEESNENKGQESYGCGARALSPDVSEIFSWDDQDDAILKTDFRPLDYFDNSLWTVEEPLPKISHLHENYPSYHDNGENHLHID